MAVREQKVLKYKGTVVFEKITMSTFKRIPKLFQNNEACFMFIDEGEFSVRTPDQFLAFNKGKGLLAKCFDYFFEISKKQRLENDEIEVIGVLLFPKIVEEIFEFDVLNSNYTVNYNIKQIPINGLLKNFKESINILLNNPELADENLIKNKLREFILLLSKTQKIPSHLDFLSAMFKKNGTEFNKTINNNIYSNLSIPEFAHLCNMSLSSFKRKFKEVYNQSPKKYINERKLQKAIELLQTKKLRISEIAYECGFETISTFNRAFKSQYGKSPSDY